MTLPTVAAGDGNIPVSDDASCRVITVACGDGGQGQALPYMVVSRDTH